MTTTFITGANKGLGHETARRLIELGHTVILGARDPERGAAAAAALGARFVRIDVTDDASVAAAAADVAAHEGVLDVLINNAGVTGPHREPGELTGADALSVFDVNLFGVIRTTTAFLPCCAGRPTRSSSTSAAVWDRSRSLTTRPGSSPPSSPLSTPPPKPPSPC